MMEDWPEQPVPGCRTCEQIMARTGDPALLPRSSERIRNLANFHPVTPWPEPRLRLMVHVPAYHRGEVLA